MRYRDKIDISNILNEDGTLNENAGPYREWTGFKARDKVIEDLTPWCFKEQKETDLYYENSIIKALCLNKKPVKSTSDQNLKIFVPMEFDNQIYGIIEMEYIKGKFPGYSETVIVQIANELAETINSLKTTESNQKKQKVINICSEAIQKEKNIKLIYEIVLRSITCEDGLGFNRAIIWMINEDSNYLEPVYAIGAVDSSQAHSLWENWKEKELDLKTILSKIKNSIQSEYEPLYYEAMVKNHANYCISLNDSACSIIKRLIDNELNEINQNCNGIASINWLNEITDNIKTPFVIVPLQTGDKNIGIIYADNYFDGKPIEHMDIDLFKTISRQAGMCIQNTIENKKNLERNDMYKKITEHLIQTKEIPNSLNFILNMICTQYNIQNSILYFYDAKERLISYVASYGYKNTKRFEKLSFEASINAMNYALVPNIIKTSNSIFIENANKDERINKFWQAQLNLSGPLLAIPLKIEKHIYGILIFNLYTLNNLLKALILQLLIN